MKIIAYYRVSTKGQGRSGLGLDGQREALNAFAGQHGAKVIAEYQEIESGRRKDRPQLSHALAHAKRSKATVVVAKLDRLSRNVAFLSALLESGVDFVCCDNPRANKFTIHILAAVAEHEAEAISQRTKVALKAAKRRGTLLGSSRPGHWKGRESARQRGAKLGGEVAALSHKKAADEAYIDLYKRLRMFREEGSSFAAIAILLTEQGHTTRNGKQWNASQVLRVLRRAETVAA